MNYPYSICVGGLNLVRIIDPKDISSSVDLAIFGQVTNIYSLEYTSYVISYTVGETYITKIDLSKTVPEISWVFSSGIITLPGYRPTIIAIEDVVYAIIPISAVGTINGVIIKLDINGVEISRSTTVRVHPEIIGKTSKGMMLVKFDTGTSVFDYDVESSSISFKIQDAVITKNGIVAAHSTSIYVLSDLLYEISKFNVGRFFNKLAVYTNDLIVGFSFNGTENTVYAIDISTGYINSLFTLNDIHSIDEFIVPDQVMFSSDPLWSPGDKFTVKNALDALNNVEYTVVGNTATIHDFPGVNNVEFNVDPVWPIGASFVISGSTSNDGVYTIHDNVAAPVYEVNEVINIEAGLGVASSPIYNVTPVVLAEIASTATGTLYHTPAEVTEFFIDRYSRFHLIDGASGVDWYGTPNRIREVVYPFPPLSSGKSMSGNQSIYNSEPYSIHHVEFLKDDTSETMFASLSFRTGVFGLSDYRGTVKGADGCSFVFGPNYVFKINKNGNVVGTYSTNDEIIDVSVGEFFVWALTEKNIYVLHEENLSLQKLFQYSFEYDIIDYTAGAPASFEISSTISGWRVGEEVIIRGANTPSNNGIYHIGSVAVGPTTTVCQLIAGENFTTDAIGGGTGNIVAESITAMRNSSAFLTYGGGNYRIFSYIGNILWYGVCEYPPSPSIPTSVLLFGKKPKFSTSFNGVVVPIIGGTDPGTPLVPSYVMYSRRGALVGYGDLIMPFDNTYGNRLYPTNDGWIYYLWDNVGQTQLDQLSESGIQFAVIHDFPAGAGNDVEFAEDPGWSIGMTFEISGSTSNDGIYTISDNAAAPIYGVVEAVVEEAALATSVAQRNSGSSFTQLLPDALYGEIAVGAYGDIVLFKEDDAIEGKKIILLTRDSSGLLVERWDFDLTGTIMAEGVLSITENIFGSNIGVDLLSWSGNELYSGQIKTWAGYDYEQNKLKLIATGLDFYNFSITWNARAMVSIDGGPYGSYPLVDIGNGMYSVSINLGSRPLYIVVRFELIDTYNHGTIKRNHILSFVRR
jgi:hypothetical protein